MIDYKSPLSDFLSEIKTAPDESDQSVTSSNVSTPLIEPSENYQEDSTLEDEVIFKADQTKESESPVAPIPSIPISSRVEKISYLKKIKAIPLLPEYYSEWMFLYTYGRQRNNLHYENVDFVSYVNKSIFKRKNDEYWDQKYWYVNGDSFDPKEVPYLIGGNSVDIFISESYKYDIEDIFPDDIDETPGLTKCGHNNIYTFGYADVNGVFHKFAETNNPNPTVFKDTVTDLN